ncbi:hypothetical protein PIB30_048205 [Stylosanthes scabra]|uniref:Uncharacterized protein n=1 Tax=Stylosanthes scabra TaxID=79078 RepID=A0ABU6RHK1_9FABA|nr:hypothetical protein [Stylosanthes scabra]
MFTSKLSANLLVVVASFLSDQPPKQICADFEQNSVPEFQEQESEAEIDEGDAATIQNATKFLENSDQEIANTDQELTTDPTQFHQIQEITNLNFQFQIQTELAPAYQKPESSIKFWDSEITTSEQSKSETEFQILNISSTHQEEEWNSANTKDQNQEDKDELDARRVYRGLEDRSTTVAVQRPPPEPPDLYLFEVRDGEPPDLNSIAVGECELASAMVSAGARSCRPDDLMDPVTGIQRGTEDSAIAKGNLMEVGSADLTRSSSTVVGAFAEGMWTVANRRTAAAVADIDFRARLLRQVFLLNLPPLLAAILPWDCDGGVRTEKKQEVVAVTNARTIERQWRCVDKGSFCSSGSGGAVGSKLRGRLGSSWVVVDSRKKKEAVIDVSLGMGKGVLSLFLDVSEGERWTPNLELGHYHVLQAQMKLHQFGSIEIN